MPHTPGVNQESKAGPNVYTETHSDFRLSVLFCEIEHRSSLAWPLLKESTLEVYFSVSGIGTSNRTMDTVYPLMY